MVTRVGGVWRRFRERVNWEFGTDKDLPYSTGNSAQYFAIT